ncbi:TetR/AcrR family transcriptional regulator [Ureibacillus sp. Re31]|uniref:TetR/AcrR family transcriptional regulator n=1 Tax=Ureibacillus galli TaxID=2762222 RepID=A0ABR8XGE1_9BACL|nr:TetR/AcrR family transcriptional regulator [Ureibacillus galli]MBD8028300.1 TetR/AcrR family transcriptional regulator [Ureibacillus galli]
MRRTIINESIDLFDKKGYSKTSIQDIVNSIGATKGTFYYYFNSKQELLRDIHLSYIQELLQEQEVILHDSNLTSKDKIRKLILLIIGKIRTHGKSARVFTREIRHLEEEHIQYVNSIKREFRLNFQKVLEDGVEKGEFRKDLRSDIVTFGILGMVNRSYNWYNPDGEVSEEELVDIYMDIIINGLINNK